MEAKTLKSALAALRANEAKMRLLNANTPASPAAQEAADAAFEILSEMDSQLLETAVAALMDYASLSESEAWYLIIYEDCKLDALIAKLA